MGIRAMTLRDAAAALATSSLARRRLRPIPPGAGELVLEQALRELPGDCYFAGFRGFPGSVGALLRAVELLKNCLWSPETLRGAAGRLGKGKGDAADRLGELASLWEVLERFKKQRGLYDVEDLLREAARPPGHDAAKGGTHAPDFALLYGFYDLTPLQRELVRRVAGMAAGMQAYLLWDEEDSGPRPGFEYASPTVEFLQELLGARRVELLGDVPRKSDLRRLRCGMFSRHQRSCRGGAGLDSPLPASPDGSVRIVHCPGETAEAEEVAREVLRCFRDASGPLNALVVARAAEGVAEGLSEAFGRAGIRHYMNEGRPLAGTVSGRIVLNLLELAEGEAERADVVEFLSVAHIRWPADLHATALDRLSRLAGIVKGWDGWLDGMARWADSQAGLAERAEPESEGTALRGEARLGRIACGFLREFFQQVRGLRSVRTWDGMARRLEGLAEQFIPPGEEGRAAVLGLVRGLSALDVTGVRAEVRRAAWVLGRSLRRTSRKGERFQYSAVAFCGIMTSRGATGDVVFVPRLLEKGFPRRIPGDPLLSDRDRRILNALSEPLSGGELPLQRRQPEEERYLFRLALGSARRAVVLTYPRLEQDTGRPRVPSRFVHQACEALCDQFVEPQSIEAGTLGGLVRRVRLDPLVSGRDALDGWEYDLSVHRRAANREQAVRYTGELSPSFRKAVEMDMERWSRREFGPYDGKVRDPELLRRLGERYAPVVRPVSPSRLETYARCPFDYFLRHVLNVEELEKPAEEVEIPALEWGHLIHGMFRAVYARELIGRPLGEVTDADIEGIEESAARELERIGASHAAARPAAWAAGKRKALAQFRRVLRAERDKDSDAVPQYCEFAFGPREDAGGFAVPMGPGKAIELEGRVDRVDGLPGRGIQVLDYKSGTSRSHKKNSLQGGRQLQLPLYLLAASSLLGRGEGRARYLFTAEQKFMDEFTLDDLERRSEDLRRVLRLIVDGIIAGDFFPLPQDSPGGSGYCEAHCPFRSICGPARAKRSAIKNNRGNAGDLARLWELWAIG